jgi:hypothetical protein
VCLIKHTEGQRATLASKQNLNLHHVPKASIGVNLGFSHHHPGNNIFYSPPSSTPLIRDNFEIVSVVPFGWKLKTVVQQTYITNINPSYQDIIRRDNYPQQHHDTDNPTRTPINSIAESAEIDPVTTNLLPPAASPVPDSASTTGPDPDNPQNVSDPSNLDSRSAQISPTLLPPPPTHRYPIHTHRAPSHLACNLSTLPETTKASLFLSNSEETEFSIKKGLLMKDYKHAVGPALHRDRKSVV